MMGTFCSKDCTAGPCCGVSCMTHTETHVDPNTQLVVTTVTTTITEDPVKTVEDVTAFVTDVVKSLTPTPKHKYNLKITHNFDLDPTKLLNLTVSTATDKLKVQRNPSSIDLRARFHAPYDQGDLGSCTANALCGIIGFVDKEMEGSRLFLYYNERKIEGSVREDAGAYLSDGIKSLETFGICEETSWPYVVDNFTVEPAPTCYAEALDHQVLQARQLRNDLFEMKTALAQGYPFVVGIVIFDSFESDAVASTGVVPMPDQEKETVLGGHAVACVGYDDKRGSGCWIMRNSWGSTWGDGGYFYLPYAYLTDSSLATDLWTIVKMEV